MKLNELSNLVENTDVMDAATFAFNSFTSSRQMKRYSDKDAPSQSNGGVEFGIRDWGTWQVPADAEDDGDYDWEEPTPETEKAAKEILNKCKEKFPKREFKIHPGEKNWLYVKVS